MAKRRKLRIPKATPVPPMTQLKQLVLRERHHGESIAMWLEDKPQTEVAKLILRNFNIDLGAEESACPSLSRWLVWWEELPKTEARNAFTEFLEEEAASGRLGMPAEEARDWVLGKVTLFARASEDPDQLLALAKELRQGMDSVTKREQAQLAKDKFNAMQAAAKASVEETGKKLAVTPEVLAQIVSALDARLTAL